MGYIRAGGCDKERERKRNCLQRGGGRETITGVGAWGREKRDVEKTRARRGRGITCDGEHDTVILVMSM